MLSSQSIHRLLYLRTNQNPFFDIWSGNVWKSLMQIPKLSLFLFMTFTKASCEEAVELLSAELQVGHLRCCFNWKKMLSVRPFCHSIAITSCVTDPFI